MKRILNNKAYTLPEVMISLTILMFVIYITTDFIRTGFKANQFTREQDQAVQIARDTMATILKEVRGANTSEQGDYPLTIIEGDELSFFTDIDYDGIFEKVTYFKDGSVLKKNITEPGALNDYSSLGTNIIAAEYLNNDEEDVFSYFDSDYNDTSTINEVRLIKIILKINVTPSISPNDVYVESDVNLRNLKDNL